MSYRELRNLCEMTRAIGYPRILSLENFRTPNFKLVAELLEWIVKRFDPSATISAEQTETEQDRVLFIKQAVLLLLQNSRLKLNPRKLYQVYSYLYRAVIHCFARWPVSIYRNFEKFVKLSRSGGTIAEFRPLKQNC
ncbi:hypothetical protein ANCCAN_11464 [Ancylostoma caninum]|uniref:Calponin-homology (CH) domain-containing protein n=1 Tax=Ancylostoma caninum TaxID=29170 RepID=A0A368GDR8_ANCCA|nr:hypothetical protein ANCCAN_11464 [Ancylostoma caninum]